MYVFDHCKVYQMQLDSGAGEYEGSVLVTGENVKIRPAALFPRRKAGIPT